MKKIITNNFKKKFSDLRDFPSVKPTRDDNPPSYTLFKDRDTNKSEFEIKEDWKKPNKFKKKRIYQKGIDIPSSEK